MSLATGIPPRNLTEEESPKIWSDIEIDIVAKWQSIQKDTCPGCGRPISQHLFNEKLGREETIEDYMPWSIECPAVQAIAEGQEMWRKENKSAIDSFHKGHIADPSSGIYWLSQGEGEILPDYTKGDGHVRR